MVLLGVSLEENCFIHWLKFHFNILATGNSLPFNMVNQNCESSFPCTIVHMIGYKFLNYVFVKPWPIEYFNEIDH